MATTHASRAGSAALLLAGVLVLGGRPASGDEPRGEDDESPAALREEIDRAVEKGVAWLLARQGANGSWGVIEGNAAYGGGAAENAYLHPAGPTALALYALLKSGVPADHERVRRGFRWLRKEHEKPGGSYETSMTLLAVTATADPDHGTRDSAAAGARVRLSGDLESWARTLRDHLLAKRRAAKTRGWRYQTSPPGAPARVPEGGDEDLSSTQLAALALFAAERAGLETPLDVWLGLVDFALAQQEREGPEHPRAVRPRGPVPGTGKAPPTAAPAAPPTDRARGFAYVLDPALHPDEGAPTGSMTACGLGTLLLARWSVLARSERAWNERPRAWREDVQRAVHDGFAWLDRSWSPYSNPRKRERNVYHLYYVYAVERAMDLVGAARLGARLWYPEMARQVVVRQREKGFWDSDSTHAPGEVLDTCFALLVLRRATRDGVTIPVVTDDSAAPSRDGR
jgi:hypothetical protein